MSAASQQTAGSTPRSTVRPALGFVGRGFCMGAADIVPGVSGGTVALIFGIYERLVRNIRIGAGALGQLLRLDVRTAWQRVTEVEWGFLAPLLVGIGVSIVTLARVIRELLDSYPVETAAVFFGLVAASIVVAWRLIRAPVRTHGVVIATVAVAVFALLGLQGSEVRDPGALVLFGSGALAICAMILPGISGSFILLMLGVYHPVLEAVEDFDLAAIAMFALGAVVGLALFVWILDWVLQRYHDLVVAGLIGLMLGSLRVLWPWPADVPGDDTRAALEAPPAGEWIGPLVLAVVAAGAVLYIARSTRSPAATPAMSDT